MKSINSGKTIEDGDDLKIDKIKPYLKNQSAVDLKQSD